MDTAQPQLVLASTSPFRRELLGKLGLPFVTAKPDTDETPLANEAPDDLVARLSLAKAKAVAADHPNALIIGSDQVAFCNGQILGKPGNHARATAQLQLLSGQSVRFFTGLTLLDTRSQRSETVVEPFDVHLRELTLGQIDNYLSREEPYHCAGAFKSEGLGIALFRRLEGNDPNALIGLPLIQLVSLLEKFGVKVV